MISAICEYTSSAREFDTYVRNDVTACHDVADSRTGKAWSDGHYGCDAYAVHADWCSKFGSIDHDGGSANDRCCVCGGGALQLAHPEASPTPSPTPAPATSGDCFQNGHPCVEDSQCCSSTPGSCFYDGARGPGGTQLLVGRCMILDGPDAPDLHGCIPSDETAPQGWNLCYDDSVCCSQHCQVTPILSPANGLAVQYVGKCVSKP